MKPEVLYRGVKIRYDVLQNFNFYGVNLLPPNPPKIDENGRKTVGDGNEYGIYMTDHKEVAKVYSDAQLNDGLSINRNVFYGIERQQIMIPAVGVFYEINTNGMEVHKPWITSYLKGHYNNGMGGDEWISEVIPASNYKIIKIKIGEDNLHKEEIIEISDITKVEEIIKRRIEERKKHLELFALELGKVSPLKRMNMMKKDIELYKDIFGDNGVRYTESDNIQINNGKDYVKYLLSVFYKRNTEQIDLKTLGYIETIKERLNDTDDVEKLIQIIDEDIIKNSNNRQSFVEKKHNNGEIANTKAFDDKEKMYSEILNILNQKRKKQAKEELINLKEQLTRNEVKEQVANIESHKRKM